MSVVRKVTKFLIPVATLAVLVSSSPVIAAPWLSGPSSVETGEQVILRGGGLPSNQNVIINVYLPDGRILSINEVVDPEGKLAFELPISIAGHYHVEILTVPGWMLSSRMISSASVMVNP